MKEEVFFKVEVEDISKRKRIIKENLKHRPEYKGPFQVKGKFKNYPVVKLDIRIPVYHLNNGRTREKQRSYIIKNNKSEKAKRLLGYNPKYSLTEGLKHTIQWYYESTASK